MQLDRQTDYRLDATPEFLSEPADEVRPTGLQLSVWQLFLVTAGCAVMLMIYQFAGPYWCILAFVAVVCLRLPAYDGLNPIAQAIAYAVIVLALTCGLAYAFNVAPIAAIVPCCMMPSLAYLVGFAKGMNQ